MDPNKEYVVAVYGGPPPMGVEPEKKNIREIVIDYIRKRKDVELVRSVRLPGLSYAVSYTHLPLPTTERV